MDIKRLQEEERRRKLAQASLQAIEHDFERARTEMQGLLARNRELVDENEELRTKVYYMEQDIDSRLQVGTMFILRPYFICRRNIIHPTFSFSTLSLTITL